MMAMVVVLEVAWQLKGWRTVLYLQDNLSSLTNLLEIRIISVLCSLLKLQPDSQLLLIKRDSVKIEKRVIIITHNCL